MWLVIFGSMATPATAAADWLLTPFIGANWAGNATFNDFDEFDDEFEQRVNFGASLGWMGGGAVGLELDFGFSPNFFENTEGEGNFAFGDSNVTTLMGNLLIGAPIGGQRGPGIRPYGLAGLGLVKSHIDGVSDLFDVDANSWGFSLGAGLIAFFGDNVGLRGDVRYFRALQDHEPDDEFDVGLSGFSFWRGSLGVTFRF
jgi:opacity protein-like surface antigen